MESNVSSALGREKLAQNFLFNIAYITGFERLDILCDFGKGGKRCYNTEFQPTSISPQFSLFLDLTFLHYYFHSRYIFTIVLQQHKLGV